MYMGDEDFPIMDENDEPIFDPVKMQEYIDKVLGVTNDYFKQEPVNKASQRSQPFRYSEQQCGIRR